LKGTSIIRGAFFYWKIRKEGKDMLDKDMITLDNPKREYHKQYRKANKEQINANARRRRQKQKEKAEKYDGLLAERNKLAAWIRSRGISVEELLK